MYETGLVFDGWLGMNKMPYCRSFADVSGFISNFLSWHACVCFLFALYGHGDDAMQCKVMQLL